MSRKQIIKRTLCLLCALCLVTGLLTGCGGGGTGEQPSSESSSSGEPAAASTSRESGGDTISIMIPLFFSEAPVAGNALEQQMEEFTGVSLEFLFVPINTYTEKVNLAITSNELPSVISILEPKSPVWINSARGGMFWDITDRFDQLPALSANYDAQTLRNASIDGSLYGLPRGRPLTRDGVIYRKDWAEKVGITVTQPASLDDIYELIKAFATQDPNGSGKDDTNGVLVGVGEDGSISGYMMEMLDVAHGGGNGWLEQDGQLVPTFTTPEHLQSMNWMKRLYDEGLMNRDFATLKSSQFMEALDKEQAGLYFQTLTDAHERLDNIVQVVQSRNPELAALPPTEAKTHIIDTIYQIQGPDGEIRANTEPGFNGLMAFPKSSNKTEEDLMRVLHFFDALDTPDGQSIIYWGVEGIHYTLDESGQAVMTEDSLLFSREVQPYWQMFATNRIVDRSSIQGYVSPMYTKVYAEMESLLPYAVYNPIIPLVSDTYSTNGASLDKIINDARTKYIMGLITEDDWYAAIEQWRQSGGDKVIEEYTAQHRQISGQ